MKKRVTPWLIGGVLAVALAATVGYALGSGTAVTGNDAQQAKDEAYEVAYEDTLATIESMSRKQGLKEGTSRGIRAARRVGEREGFDLGGGEAGIQNAKDEAEAAAAEQAAAEASIAERQANCGVIPEAPDVCPTSAELSEYEAAAAAAAAAPVEPGVGGGPFDDGR